MHLLKDENGNLIPHGGHHDHDHHHDHHEHHGHEEQQSPEGRAKILLNYMIDHNAHHIEEMEELALSLEASNSAEAAAKIREAEELFRKGNALLGEVEIKEV